jgi:hypothetical protein
MRIALQKKSNGHLVRAERLRAGRAASQPLRSVSPGTGRLDVQLHFPSTEEPQHAAQSFSLYPGARAYFGFPCPFGDCDGIYDLAPVAESGLSGKASKASGELECAGARSRDGQRGQPCGLRLRYALKAQHEKDLPEGAAFAVK